METKNIILDKSFEFAIAIIEFCKLLETQKKYVIARQILKSGTSIGANVREAQSCESKTDFVHRLKIAAKETDETEYWILLCKHSKNYPFDESLLSTLIVFKDFYQALSPKPSNHSTIE